MIIIGNGADEVPRMTITLAANASMNIFPLNRNTQFTNELPREITKGAQVACILCQIRKIFLPTELIRSSSNVDRATNLMQIRLKELEPQLVNDETESILALFNVQKAGEKVKADVKYICHEFENTPILRLRNTSITHLTIVLTTVNGEEYPLRDNLPPVFVQMDFLSSNDVPTEATIYCLSHGKENLKLFPHNTLTKFRVQLGKVINLSGWEMALSSISMPPLGHEEDIEVTMTVVITAEKGLITAKDREEMTTFAISINKTDTIRKVYQKMQDAIEENELWAGRIHMTLKTTKDEVEGWLLFLDGYESRPYGAVFLSPRLAQICGHGFKLHKMFVAVRTDDNQRLKRTNMLAQKRIRRLFPPSEYFAPPIALLYCNLLETSPVGNTMAPIMEIIPVSSLSTDDSDIANEQKMYRPKILQFRTIQASEVREIEFDIRSPTGREVQWTAVDVGTLRSTGGTIIELKLRAKTSMVQKPDGTVNFKRGDWQRDRVAQLK